MSNQQSNIVAFPFNLHLSHLNEQGQLQQQIRDLNNFIEEDNDFWEFLEDELGQTRKELWDKISTNSQPI